MIDLNTSIARDQLMAIYDRIIESEITHDIAQGTWRPREDYLLPAAYNQARKRAYTRALRQMQTLGPRIMHTKTDAILGSINWSGNDQEIDEALRSLDLMNFARKSINNLIIDGIAAGMAHTMEDGTTRITRLGGYLQPYTNEYDMDQIDGLYQAWSTSIFTSEKLTSGTRESDFDTNDTNFTRTYRWTVRIYDWSDGENNATIREWRNLNNPTLLGTPPTTIENAPVPRLAQMTTTNDGLPIGEMLQAAPSLMALWKTEANLTLVEELAAFPMLAIKGTGDLEAIGPAEPIALDSDGDAYWMEPGNLDQLRAQRGIRMERLREDLALPGGFLGSDSPSGEAFKEANIRFRQNARGYAEALSSLLTELVADYAALIGTQPEVVHVTPTDEYDNFGEKAQWTISLYEKGIIPLDVAAREMQAYYGHWDDEELQAWITRQTATVSADDLRAALNGQ